jgi:hypothetical protein
MSKVINILKQNSELKRQLNEVLSLVRENDIKSWGYKAIEYAFLNAKSLRNIDIGPLVYLEEVFSIDRVFLLINIDRFPNLLSNRKYDRILFYNRKAFEYFFFSKKPFAGCGEYNLTKEFKLVENTKSYLIIPILRGDYIVGSLNLYSFSENKFNGNFAVDFAKDLVIKIGYILFNMNKLKGLKRKLKECEINGCLDLIANDIICPRKTNIINQQYNYFFIKFNFHSLDVKDLKRNILFTNNIFNKLRSIQKIDHIIKPYSDLFVLYTSERIMQKVNEIINMVKNCIDNYIYEKKIVHVKYDILQKEL